MQSGAHRWSSRLGRESCSIAAGSGLTPATEPGIQVRITVVHNPTAGEEDHSANDIVGALDAAGHQTRYQSTKENQFGRVLDKPADLILVAGGDGTVKKVATALVGGDVPMAILPLGTANNVARALGAVTGLQELVDGLSHASRRRLDIGVARAPFGERRFIEGLGGGSFARLVRSGSRAADGSPFLPESKIDRALELLHRDVSEAEPHEWELRVDGVDLSGHFLLVEVMNIPFLGPNVPVAINADPGDGLLDVVALEPRDRGRLLDYLDSRILGGAIPLELQAVRGHRVELSVKTELLHADDAPWPDAEDDPNSDDDHESETGRTRSHEGVNSIMVDVDAVGVELLVVRAPNDIARPPRS